jgi:hypothetical protein
VQVWIDRDHGIEQSGQETPDDPLAHGFARCKSHVLAHIREIGRHQTQVFGTQRTRGLRRQQQLDQFIVRLVQGAQQHDTRGQFCAQAKAGFSIRKSMALHGHRLQPCSGAQAKRGIPLVVKIQQHASALHGVWKRQGRTLEKPSMPKAGQPL